MRKIYAPFTEEQVAALNAWQSRPGIHPFTCPDHSQDKPLLATPSGFRCVVEECKYSQDWAHGFMAQLSPSQLA